jgi:hypothetical protein
MERNPGKSKYEFCKDFIRKLAIKLPTASSPELARRAKERYKGKIKNVEGLARQIRRWLNDESFKKEQSPAKVLFFDIETSFMVAGVFSLYPTSISTKQILQDWNIVCWSAKWLYSDTIINACQTPEEAKKGDDLRITENLWHLLNEADIIVAHNLVKFDEKKVNSRFLKHGMTPPSPYQKIDTLKVARQFGMTSKRLDFIAQFLQLPSEGKLKTDFDLWKRCYYGEKEALDEMQRYCDHDIDLLIDTYLHLRPWMSNHPNIGLFVGSIEPVCKACGSNELSPYGYHRTRVNEYPAFKCDDCGAISIGTKNITSQSTKDRIVK